MLHLTDAFLVCTLLLLFTPLVAFHQWDVSVALGKRVKYLYIEESPLLPIPPKTQYFCYHFHMDLHRAGSARVDEPMLSLVKCLHRIILQLCSDKKMVLRSEVSHVGHVQSKQFV